TEASGETSELLAPSRGLFRATTMGKTRRPGASRPSPDAPGRYTPFGAAVMLKNEDIYALVEKSSDIATFREQHWEGAFDDYLKLVAENPRVLRNAFQRMHDMILSYGTEEFEEHKEKLLRYRFFDDPVGGGKDAIFGLEKPLMKLVRNFKAAANAYGTERRILLLHGPVGSSKSTIARLLKKGLEAYS